MTIAERTAELFELVVRLRRVERSLPRDEDLVAVRAALEDDLGSTVSKRAAARLLGVSHAALKRWVDAGDIPTVYNERGRTGVPTAALFDLRESVDRARHEGRSHVLEPILTERRRRAAALDVRALVGSVSGGDPHARARRRSLAYHRLVARDLRRPAVDEALRTIWKWRAQDRIDDGYADQWENVLRRPLREVKLVLAEDSERADDLRQSSPFAGALSEPERRRILAAVA